MCLIALFSTSSVHAQTWLSVGPANGSIARVVVAPSLPATLLAVPDEGGLFLTTNSGGSWRSIGAGLCDLHVNHVAFHPTTAATIYAATNTAGVCRTTDSGATWTPVASGLPVDANGYGLRVGAIAINPAVPSTLLAGTKAGVYRSTDAGGTWTAAGPVVSEIFTIAIAPSAPATAYAAAKGTMLKTTDSGASWTAVSAGLPGSFNPLSLTVDPADANVAYLSAETIYKTSNGGALWAVSSSGIGSSSFLSEVAVDKTNSSVLYVAAPGACGVCRSTNAGASWSAVPATGLPGKLGLTSVVQSLASDPAAPARFYAGTPQGAYKSTDSGVTWVAINTNLASREMVAPAISGAAPASLLAGERPSAPSSSIVKLSGGLLPFSTITGPAAATAAGGFTAIVTDPGASNVIYALAGTVSDQGCSQPFKTTDGGGSWTLMRTGLLANACGNALAIDPSAPSTLYLAVFTRGFNGVGCCQLSLYKSTDGAANWVASNGGIDQNSVNRVAVSPQHSNVIYAAGGGSVYRSTTSGANWILASAGLPTGAGGGGVRHVSRLAIDPTNDNIVYAATLAGVFRTANGGAAWTARQTGWPTINGVVQSAQAIAVDPITPTTIYASPSTPTPGPPDLFFVNSARGAGLMKSTDSGATWSPAGREIAGTFVNDVIFDGAGAAYATTSNGVFRFSATNPALITVDRTALTFAATNAGSSWTSHTAAQEVRLTQGPGAAIAWTATADKPWLTVTPASGTGSAVLSVGVAFHPSAPASGIVTGTIAVALTGAANTTGPVNVTLNVVGTAVTTAPSGSFDTPLDGSTGITGSIAVTGWAVDDVEVTRVRIWRAPVTGEGAGALVFLGDAVLVDGARPDVQAAFPDVPRSTRSGWGYLMLTNFLPNLGNGTFTLTATAEDADGHSTILGTKTITCANSTATAPTGAIDTPAQGATVSGSVTNFGWVLSPGTTRRSDPPSGGAVQIIIDGAAIAAVPSGWTSRADLSAVFPAAQFAGISNALGVAAFDSTSLADGVHTISWVVTDNQGSASGIGSRYFTVANGGGVTAAVRGQHADAAALIDTTSSAGARPTLLGRRGFGDRALQAYPARDGVVTIQAEELDRIELHLGAQPGVRYGGYLRAGGALAALPTGSALDAATGVFTWAPGVAYLGSYDLRFERSGGAGPDVIDVRIVLNPKGSNRVGPQTIIDTPAARRGAIAAGAPFVLAGWAVDLDAGLDSGVDAVHVWAYPVAGGEPEWIGAAAYGGTRRDVADIYGERFATSGYGLTVPGLAPGTYDLAVFAYSTVRGAFVPATTVRVTVR